MVRARLIREGNRLTLERATEICRIAVISNAQLKSPAQTQSRGLHAVRTGTAHRQKASVESDSFACKRCDKTHARRQCPAWGKQCSWCNSYNHLAKTCKKSKPTQQQRAGPSQTVNKHVHTPHAATGEPQDHDSVLLLLAVMTNSNKGQT